MVADSTITVDGHEIPVVTANTVVVGTGAAGYCAAARDAGFFVAGVRDPLYAGREEEIQALCRGWVDDFRRVPEPLLKRVLGTCGQPAGRGSKQ